VWPVTIAAAGEARKTIAAATSSGRATRPSGVMALMRAMISGCWVNGLMNCVSTQVGATALTRMPCCAHSTASARVKLTTAPLLVW
jgi:hypothetical protein